MKKSARGFTLVELLVVIAIMALTGTVILANYGSFGEDQKLKNAVLDIQSQLRSAQTNATANTKCNSQSGATWQVEFLDTKTVNLKCQESATLFPKKTLTLGANIEIQAVSGISCPSALPFTVSFDPLNGKMNLGGANCTLLTITLINTKTTSTKALTVEQGGRIYAP